VRVLYFAELRERAGRGEEILASTAGTPAELYAELQARYAFAPPYPGMTVVVNDEIVARDSPIAAGDTLAFLTPFGGGA
jgi:molybdopterin converting factor small subunit